MTGERLWQGLTPAQVDGLGCVICGADFLRVLTPHVPVGRSVTGSQVFACVGQCAARSTRAEATDSRAGEGDQRPPDEPVDRPGECGR